MEEYLVEIDWTRVGKSDCVDGLTEENDYGLYEIAGYHPVFGDDSLLYIGMTQDQTFSERFMQHKSWLKDEWDITVYVGRIRSIDGKDSQDFHGNLWRSVVEDAEALLIYFHAPPYNSRSISEFPEPTHNLRIINLGDCGDLYPEVSHRAVRPKDGGKRPE